MFRQISMGAAAVLAAGILAAGCSDDSGGDTIISGGNFATDQYPGSQVVDSNVADDGKAFTNQAQSIQGNDEFKVFRNVSNGTAIVLYVTETTSSGSTILNASYYDGSRFHAPVQIRGRHLTASPQVFSDPFSGIGGFKVLWLNTSGNSTAEVAARNGDALILFTATDESAAPGVTSGEEPNTRLWFTYFDVSAANAAAANGVQGGFTVDAITVDDEQIYSANTDPSVDAFGFASDSIHCAHEFTSGTDEVDSGDPTNGAIIVYAQQESLTTGYRFHQNPVNLDAPDNDLDGLLAGESTISIASSAVAGDNVQSGGFLVYDEFMIYQTNVADAATTDFVATLVQFDEDGEVDVAELNTPVIASNDRSDGINDIEAGDIYGRDHGLAALYVVFEEFGFAPDATPDTGDRDEDTDVVVAQINYDDASLTVQREIVDPFADTYDFTGGAADRDGSNTGANLIGTRLNRSGDFITILMTEVNSDSTDTATITDINTLGYAAAVHTRRDTTLGATATRDLDVSITDEVAGGNFTPVRIPSLVGSGITTTTADITNLQFQRDYVGGQAHSQANTDSENDQVDGQEGGAFMTRVGCDRGCAFQSDAFQHNFTFEQVRTTGTPLIEDLFWNGIEVTVTNVTANVADVTTPPELALVVTGAASDLVASRDTAYGQDFEPVAVDAGDLSRETTGEPTLESGRPLIFYVLDRDNPTNAGATNNITDLGLFAWEDGEEVQVSTVGPRQDWDQFTALLDVVQVAVDENATSNPNHGGSRVHVLWLESRADDFGSGNVVDGIRLMTRSYEKSQINDNDSSNDTLEVRFTPDTTEDPVQIDNPIDGDLLDTQAGTSGGSQVYATARGGSTVGLYFTEDEHVYFTDTTTDALGWDTTAGVSAPQLVDNDDTLGQRVIGWRLFSPPECDDLAKGMLFFAREESNQFGANGTARRAYVRVHN